MLGRFITGFADGGAYDLFALAIAIALPCAYVLMGATWLVLKTEGELQSRAAHWGRLALIPVVVGMGLISLATPWVSDTVSARWFSLPQFIGLLPIPFATFACFVALWWTANAHWARFAGCPSS
jgi:cytochrome d ubiquinol oxidase subunit II